MNPNLAYEQNGICLYLLFASFANSLYQEQIVFFMLLLNILALLMLIIIICQLRYLKLISWIQDLRAVLEIQTLNLAPWCSLLHSNEHFIVRVGKKFKKWRF